METHFADLPLRIAVSFGARSPHLATLIGLQRREEPQTPVLLHEVTLAEQFQGLREDRYDAGLALASAHEHGLHGQTLWSDELAVALPQRSHLLAMPSIPLKELARCAVVRWATSTCSPISQLVDALLGSCEMGQQENRVKSFEAMALLVAAGYGIGLGPRTLIETARGMNIVMRPLAGVQLALTTHLLYASSGARAEVDRLAQRARAITGACAQT